MEICQFIILRKLLVVFQNDSNDLDRADGSAVLKRCPVLKYEE